MGFVCNRVTLIILVPVLVAMIAWISLEKKGSRTTPAPDSPRESISPVVFVNPPSSRNVSPARPTTDKQATQQPEWCETDRARQLGNHAVFGQFEQWLNVYEKTYFKEDDFFTSHTDPRAHLFLRQKGLRISSERAKILESLITYDPQRAIELALSPERIRYLPPAIQQNMESWHATQADLKAVHVCFNHKSTKGRIKRWVTLRDGRTLEAFVYGDRRFLATVKNLAISGISIGEKFAVSEKAYRIVKELPENKYLIEYAGSKFTVDQGAGIKAMDRRIRKADLRSLRGGRFQTPLIASSLGGTNLLDAKYELITTPMTWADANQTAFNKKGRLVCINSSIENNIVFQLLKDAKTFGILPDGSSAVQYSWIGATDNEDQTGSFLDKDANQSIVFNINANEGDWHWLSGQDISASNYQNWNGGNEPANVNKDFGAVDWSTEEARWIDLNETHRLPFVIEYDIDLTPVPTTMVNGKRKVLVIPARFQDEGNNFRKSSSRPVDEFGNPITSPDVSDAFEPDTRENLIQVMKEVKDFYLRNSDGTFHLESVITPPVTIPLPKYEENATSILFDSTGVTPRKESYDEISEIGAAAVLQASQISRYYNYFGPAFQGVLSIDLTPFGAFEKTPAVTLRGGDVDPATGVSDPEFEVAQAEALVNAFGQITQIVITEPGAFYHGTPTLYLDNDPSFNSNVTFTMGRTVVTWAAVTTYGEGGLGVVGGAGTHVNAPATSGVMAHEIGHNFGLWHANRYVSDMLTPTSDEGTGIDYGNPFSLMGEGGITGDLTISSKVFLKDVGHFGLNGGTGANNAIDVAHLVGAGSVESSGLNEGNAENNNTFRIYRHDYGSAPYPLRTGRFKVVIPDNSKPLDLMNKLPLKLSIGGPGDGSSGWLEKNGSQIELYLASPGKGYSEEPVVQVFDSDDQTVLLTLDQRWILERAGTLPASMVMAHLRDFATTAHRGLRGIEIPASPFNPRGFSVLSPLGSYWISYRRNVSEFGLSVINGTTQGWGTSENYLIDTTSATQGRFEDAFLLLGRTFSDYEADSHITPISKGGVSPMDFIDVVVNLGTVASGAAKVPQFSIQASNLSPKVNEPIDITIIPADGNTNKYAYSWYQNEIGMDEFVYLNRRTISKTFTSTGQHVIRVIVSDMKGGVSSRNLIIRVGKKEETGTTLISGQVRSNQGPVQGAKVLLRKAPIVEHQLSVAGTLQDSRIPGSETNHLRFVIDNENQKQLIMHRGEIHRFYLDPSSKGNPIAFFDRPDHEPAKVKVDLLVTPLVDFGGSGYVKPPEVNFEGGSLFDTHFSKTVTTIYDYQNHFRNQPPYGPYGTAITRPSAKSLLFDTNVTQVFVRPTKIDERTGLYLHFGGTGQSRYFPPTVSIKRTSYWEDYTKPSATAIAFVDGVGTINVTTVGSGYPEPPQILLLGAGREANATATTRAPAGGDPFSGALKNSILPVAYPFDDVLKSNPVTVVDQGYGFDPNSTLAVALYPHNPIAYYSFDANESLFGSGPLKPTSGFNNSILKGFKHYWQMNEENATDFENNVSGINLSVNSIPDNSIRSYWGIKHKAIRVQPGDTFTGTASLNKTGPDPLAQTISLWVYPLSSGGGVPSITLSSLPFTTTLDFFNNNLILNGVTLTPSLEANEWCHLAITDDGTDTKVYLNGNKVGSGNNSFGNDLVINNGQDCLIDEIMIYERALKDFELMQLSGRVFLDLSGSKFHAAPIGGFDMNDSDPTGANDGLADSPTQGFTVNNLGQGIDLNGSQYLDLTAHIVELEDVAINLAALDRGTFSVWVKPRKDPIKNDYEDMTLLSGSNVDENNSYYRLFIRDNGTVRQQVYNDGKELCYLTTTAQVNLNDGKWHHLVVLVGDNGVSFYIDGKADAGVVPAGSINERAFMTDIDNMNHLALGYHRTSEANATNYYNGQIDEVAFYHRVLTPAEINYLYDLGTEPKPRNDRVHRARLRPEVDAVGTVRLTSQGGGYKEQPEAIFDYNHSAWNGFDPDKFLPAAGEAGLLPTYVESILLTKNFHNPVSITLPDDRNISRTHVEYVLAEDAPLTLFDANRTNGIFGYSAAPDMHIEGSPSWPDEYNATGYALMFLDRDQSVDIVHGGQGYAPAGGFNANAVRIFGEGYRPPKFDAFIQQLPGRNFSSVHALLLTQDGEGPYLANNTDDILYFGDGLGETGPAYVTTNPIYTFPRVQEIRRNVNPTAPTQGDYKVTGVLVDSSRPNPGEGHLTPPTVFADWGNEGWAGHVGVSALDFNTTLSEIVVQNPGFRYSIPVEVNLYGGRAYNSDTLYDFRPAVVEVNGTDENGSITSYSITDPGLGYIRNPIISITGGGGYGAMAECAIDFNTGTLISVLATVGGRGYFNLDSTNVPTAKLIPDNLPPSDKNASIRLRLGGSLNPPSISNFRRYACQHPVNNPPPAYLSPWVKIYDRNRTVPVEDEAEAVVKVRDGNITKIIVTRSGRGYIDPYVVIWDKAPYYPSVRPRYPKTLWQCRNMREDLNRTLVPCGHITESVTTPTNCPGETPPSAFTSDPLVNDVWLAQHARLHPSCQSHAYHNGITPHGDMGFRTRVCDAQTHHFVRLDIEYRQTLPLSHLTLPEADWKKFDGNYTALLDDGKIREIVVDKNGTRYIAPYLEFKGTGGEVDVVPMFCNEGHLINAFFDDPRIKNLEYDDFDRPLGAGQGFMERPWTKDQQYPTPVYGPAEVVAFNIYENSFFGPLMANIPYNVFPRDSWGDRVVDIEVLEPGIFPLGTQATVQVDFDFNMTRFPDAVPVTSIARMTTRLTRLQLDHNGTSDWTNVPFNDGSSKSVERSTFLAEPEVTIFNETFTANGVRTQHSFYENETMTSTIRLNGLVEYDPDSDRSYVDLVVDERLPNKFYYGLSGSDRISMGGEILVYEGMPYANWGNTKNHGRFAYTDGNETETSRVTLTDLVEYDRIAYTDANGSYALPNLEAGLYNIAVVMEDEKYQEMTFRPESNASLVSRTIYVPGMPDLELETDRRGQGKSRPVWTSEAQRLSKTSTPNAPPNPRVTLEGIGMGFKPGQAVHLTVHPHPSNMSRGVPELIHTVLVDGSLRLDIDYSNPASSKFDPNDRFTVKFASSINVSGIDFFEDFQFEDLENSFWGGTQAVSGNRQLIITPSAGGDHNRFEVPISSSGDPLSSTTFSLKAFDQLGNAVTPLTPQAQWSLEFDFNATDGNHSKIASLDTSQTDQAILTLRSTLKGGTLRLKATATITGQPVEASILIAAFPRVPLTEKEIWMDQHFYTVWESAIDWNSDDASKGFDGDGLTNSEEWTYRTDPFLSDSDGDGLSDKLEINLDPPTNPLSKDTDGDGFSDSIELNAVGLDPLAYNLAPPSPEFTLNSGLEKMSVFAGDKVLLGAIVKESSIDGSDTLTNLAVSLEGNFSQVVSFTNGEWLVSSSAPSGTYQVNYKVNDSLNREFSKSQYLFITALDLVPPSITLSHSGPLYVLKGGTYTRPSFSSYDQTDGILSAFVTVAGESSIDVNNTGVYEVIFSVNDNSGNPGSAILQVIVEDYAYVIEGKAIDGYLTGSSVIFDAYKNGVLDGVHDLANPVTTDGSGKFVLSLTTPELALFDSNQNGKIDWNEGRIIVSGGFDISTNSPFSGSYLADANSTVVSPLSTLVTSVLGGGTVFSKEEAKAKVVQALGLPATIDPTNYDPLVAAAGGDTDSAKVLLETARLANIMNQVDAFAKYRGIPFTSPGQAGTAFIKQLAAKIDFWKTGDSNPLGDEFFVQQALLTSLQAIQPGISNADTSEAVQIIRAADTLLVQTGSSGVSPNALAVSLAKNQQAIASEVIGGYDSLTANGNSISTLTITPSNLATQSASINSINVFPPSAPSFSASIRAGDWSAGKQITVISASDADGDSIAYSITSKNYDLDGDGTLPFSISSTGALSITDPDDLTPYAASLMEVTVSLADGKGMSSTIKGSLMVDNLLSLSSTPLSNRLGWATSSWFGSFYSSGSSWVFHPTLGWLYVSPDNSDGFWFWDSTFNVWWWTKPDVFPHFYRKDSGWSYWSLSGATRLYYNFSTKTWLPAQ